MPKRAPSSASKAAERPEEPEEPTGTWATLGLLWWPLFLPSLLQSLGAGFVVVAVPFRISVDEEHGGFGLKGHEGLVGTAVAGAGIGMLLATTASGWLLQSIGPRRGLTIGNVVMALAALAGGFASTVELFVSSRVVSGVGLALYFVARQLLIAESIEPAQRGKVASLVVGCARAGTALGPAMGATAAHFVHSVTPAFTFSAAMFALSAAIFYQCMTLALCAALRRASRSELGQLPPRPPSLFPPDAWLLTPCALSLALSRSAREILIPLLASELELSTAVTGFITSASFTVDMALVPLAGYVSDTWGRRAQGAPALGLLALGFVGLALAPTGWWLLAASVLVGVGNGLSNGWIQVVGADIAPPVSRAKFLGLWGFQFAVGTALGPLLVGGISDAEQSTSLAAGAVAAIALAGALHYVAFGPETLARLSPRSAGAMH